MNLGPIGRFVLNWLGACNIGLIFSWQVRLLLIQVRNGLITSLRIVIVRFLDPSGCHIKFNNFDVMLFAMKHAVNRISFANSCDSCIFVPVSVV